VNLTFLLELARLRPDDLNEDAIFAAKQMVFNTLHKMALGGSMVRRMFPIVISSQTPLAMDSRDIV